LTKALKIEDANRWKAIVEEKIEFLKKKKRNVVKVIEGLQSYWVGFFKPKKCLRGSCTSQSMANGQMLCIKTWC